MKPRHTNNGSCTKCLQIAERYPGIYEPLWVWFCALQLKIPDAHISEAGRGQDAQNRFRALGASRAHWGMSAHNYNAALDIFRLKDGKADYGRAWYMENIAPEIEDWLVWYGAPGAKFPELPHVEVKDWKGLVSSGILKLVE